MVYPKSFTKKQIKYLHIKYKADVVLGMCAAVLLLPLFAVLSLLIFLDDPGPVIFKQKRVGNHKSYFHIYKFRTMKTNTPKDVPTHLLENPEQYITRMGHFLRKTSLDELPQVFNIARGQICVCGPRPALWNQYDLIEERDKYGANDIKPGLTGWAQINGRDELEIDVKAKLDGEYVEKLGLWMDMKCFFGTFASVLKSDGVVEGGTGALQAAATREENKKVLFVATVVRLHINMFHKPYIKWFHDQGWQVDVAANNDYNEPKECIIPYCDNFYCLPFERSPIKIGNLQAYRRLKKIIKQNEYDIIHCHTPMGSVIARLAAVSARKKGTKVIYTAHGFHFFKGAPFINWVIYYPIERLLAYITDVIITMNKEDYKRARKFRAKRIEFVNGVGLDLNKFTVSLPEEKQAIREELGLKEKDIFAISVAQLIKRKNHIVLIQAIAKLANANFHLFICGDGVQLEELKEEARKLGVEGQVHFLGFQKDIYRLCSSADLFLFASLQEGLPVAVMEAMACGLPIIASNIRGNQDLIDNGKGGYLVAPTNVDGLKKRICAMLEHPEKLNSMKEYNLKKVKNYSIDFVVEQMADIYKSLM